MLSLDGLYVAECLKLTVPAQETVTVNRIMVLKFKKMKLPFWGKVGKDIEKFLIVSSEDLEDRMDVDVWVDKIKEMENVEITECSYNMEALLGK